MLMQRNDCTCRCEQVCDISINICMYLCRVFRSYVTKQEGQDRLHPTVLCTRVIGYTCASLHSCPGIHGYSYLGACKLLLSVMCMHVSSEVRPLDRRPGLAQRPGSLRADGGLRARWTRGGQGHREQTHLRDVRLQAPQRGGLVALGADAAGLRAWGHACDGQMQPPQPRGMPTALPPPDAKSSSTCVVVSRMSWWLSRPRAHSAVGSVFRSRSVSHQVSAGSGNGIGRVGSAGFGLV